MTHTILRGGRVLDIAAGTAEPADILIEDDTIREIGSARLRRRPRVQSKSRRRAGCCIPASSTPIPTVTAISPKGWATAGLSNCC